MKKQPKDKVCRNEACGETFTPRQLGQKVCSPRCAIAFATTSKIVTEKKNLSKQRRESRENDRSWQTKQAQMIFNKFIRLRDQKEPCISCGRFHQGQNHAGHYRSVGAMPALRFNEDNVHIQCMPCNVHKSGNAIEYRINLVKKIGVERVEFLEGPHEHKKYTVEELKEIRQIYKDKIKKLTS